MRVTRNSRSADWGKEEEEEDQEEEREDKEESEDVKETKEEEESDKYMKGLLFYSFSKGQHFNLESSSKNSSRTKVTDTTTDKKPKLKL